MRYNEIISSLSISIVGLLFFQEFIADQVTCINTLANFQIRMHVSIKQGYEENEMAD